MYDSKHRTTDTQIYDTRKDGSGYSSTKREWNLQTHGFNDETSSHRKYMRTHSTSNNRIVPSSSSQQQQQQQQQRQNGEKKTVKDTKKPLRVSGDWSEFKSSTGKTYFYNCKTEISQWEKPKGWPVDESNRTSTSTMSSTSRIKKESTTNASPTVRTRYKVEESSSSSSSHRTLSQNPNVKFHSENSNHHHHHQNGNDTSQSNEQLSLPSNNRLPSPGDDSSRMSFSSTSSKESSSVHINENNGNVLHSSLSEPAISVSTLVSSEIPSKPFEAQPITVNGNDTKNSTTRTIIPAVTSTESTQVTENESPTPSISKAEREQQIQKFYRAELIQHLTDWPSTQLEKQCLKLFDDYYAYSAKMSTGFTELKALKSNFRVLEIKRNILTQKLHRCQKHAREREDNNHHL